MTSNDVRRRLRHAIADRGGRQAAIARELGVSDGFVSAVLSGTKEPTPRMLSLLGLERVTRVTYRKARPDAVEA